jgi:bis(5'-nucleosyl)-tetraphosphatase (symmetrical)
MTTYAIGDIQGCHSSLLQLIDCLHATSSNSRFIFVGDLINRGPQSLQTIREIKALGGKAKVILGNHDLHLMAVAYGIRQSHRSDTIQEILTAPDLTDLLDWLRHQPLSLFDTGHLLVHAGVVPQWTLQQTLSLAGEVEAVLRGPDWLDFLRHMYGNTPTQWNSLLYSRRHHGVCHERRQHCARIRLYALVRRTWPQNCRHANRIRSLVHPGLAEASQLAWN